MDKRELQQHKKASKILTMAPEFKNIRRKKLPRPFQQLGGDRIYGTPFIDVSDDHVLFCFFRDGETLQDSAFYGHFLCKVKGGVVSDTSFPLAPQP